MTALDRRVKRLEVAQQITRWDHLLNSPCLTWPQPDFHAWVTGVANRDREALSALSRLPDSELLAMIEAIEAEMRT